MPTPAWADAERLIAIGDLHGDYDAYRALLTQAGLIDAKGHWSGKKAVFVQMGDAVDRGTKSRDIVLDLQRLQKEASHDGGQVIALIGNHEAMNMTGDLRYVAPAEYQNFVTPKTEAVREQTFQAAWPGCRTASSGDGASPIRPSPWSATACSFMAASAPSTPR